jgi:hypothetical protein
LNLLIGRRRFDSGSRVAPGISSDGQDLEDREALGRDAGPLEARGPALLDALRARSGCTATSYDGKTESQ